MTRPLVSVVMPAYNAVPTVGAAVASVLWQNYEPFELIVVDDGSTDATAAVAEAPGGPVRVVRQANKGVAAARNAGIREARGELITFCDADDFLFAQHLAALVATYEQNVGGIATANSFWLLPGGIHHSKRRYKGGFPEPARQRIAILEQNFVSTLSLFPRSLFDQIGPFDEQRHRAEDWDFWLRAIYAGKVVALQPEPLSLYRWSTTSLSADWEQMDADIEAIFGVLEERVDLNEKEREYVRRRQAGPGPRRLAREGDEALREGRYRQAARAYGKAAALCPSERMLVRKARLLAPAPWLTGPLVRARQLRIERRLGMEAGHTR
jgi:glycosyltransferase involved in cell wall biosynthesis